MSIDTKKVTGRRELHFHQLSDIEADAQRLAGVQVKYLGNWTLGQVLGHLATVMNQSIDGMPMRVAWWLRLLGPLFKKRLIKGGMPAGFQIPGNARRAMIAEPDASVDQGLDALQRGISRLQSDRNQRSPHPVFGPMTPEEWDQVHMRHAELHLSFVVPVD